MVCNSLIRTTPKGSNRVNRGGSWNNNARNCRVTNRNNWNADNRNNNLGLRLALQLSPDSNGKNRSRLLTVAYPAGIPYGKSGGMKFRHDQAAVSRNTVGVEPKTAALYFVPPFRWICRSASRRVTLGSKNPTAANISICKAQRIVKRRIGQPESQKKHNFGRQIMVITRQNRIYFVILASNSPQKQTIMNMNIIGRKEEMKKLQACMESARSEFVVVYGRRRIGKTFLIKEFFNERFDFSFVGTRGQRKEEQLRNFALCLKRHSGSEFAPQIDSWAEAFDHLATLLGGLRGKRKKVVFFDEMPWADTHKSDFVAALEQFWNGWANLRNDILFIACGSATSWMVDRVLHNKGGLFNRVTQHIYLSPFRLSEVEQYMEKHNFGWDRYQTAQCYMALGGVPFYLTLLDPSQSLAQNIDRLFFAGENAPLRVEYDEMFTALFAHPEGHATIVGELARHREGLTRQELTELCKMGGSNLTRVLHDLERSDFIFAYSRYGNKTNNAIYRIKDFYTLFYTKFVAHHDSKDKAYWQHLLTTPAVSAWQGLSFELLCLLHLDEVKHALRIDVMLNNSSTWRSNDQEHKAQIDLVIERADRIINLCEIKFSTDVFAIDAAYERRLRERKAIFVADTKTRYATILTMITTFGLLKNKHSGLVASEVTLDDLFL